MIHGIAYDPIHDEFMVPSQLAQAIQVFRGGADGEEAPIRVIQGSRTQLRALDTVALDPVHNEIFVPLNYAILVFAREATGNVAPIRILKVPADGTMRFGMAAVDATRNLLVVSGGLGRNQPRLFIFNRTDEGYANPKAVIGGPKSGFRGAGGPFAITPASWIVATQPAPGGDHNRWSGESYVGVWNVQDNGDVPPAWTLAGPQGILQRPKGLSLDIKNKSVIVSDKGLNAILTFQVPEIF